MKKINLSQMNVTIYDELIKRLLADNISAVVLGNKTFLVNPTGAVSLLGGVAMSTESFNLFKLHLVNKYDPEHKLFE